MEHEDYVSYEQAQMLKELGFKEKCFAFYTCLGNLEINHLTFSGQHIKLENYNADSINEKYKNVSFSAPTLAQGQKWLREVKGINILVNIATNKETYITKKVFYFKWFNSEFILCGVSKYHYATYEEALLEGINKALELLKIENKDEI